MIFHRLYSRAVDLYWTLFSKEYRRLDKVAYVIACRYGLGYPYKLSRRQGCDPVEALIDNDLYDDRARHELFC